MSPLLRISLQTLLWFPLLSSCAIFGGGEETLHRAKGYSITAPKGWMTQNTGRESDHTYQTLGGNIATVTSSCQRNSHASLEVLTRHLLLGARDTSFKKTERFFVDGKEGLYSSLVTTLEGTRLFLELFVIAKNKCVFDFTLVSKNEVSEKERNDFRLFFNSFTSGNN